METDSDEETCPLERDGEQMKGLRNEEEEEGEEEEEEEEEEDEGPPPRPGRRVKFEQRDKLAVEFEERGLFQRSE